VVLFKCDGREKINSMPQRNLSKREARYLYLQLHGLLAEQKRNDKDKKGGSKLHADIYTSALDKLVGLLEDWHEPASSRYLLLKVEKSS